MKILLYLLGILIFIAAMFFIGVDFSIFYLVKEPLFIFAALAVMLFDFAVIGLRMKYLLIPLGEKNFSVKKLVEIEFINRFIQYFLPAKLNIPVKALILSKECGVKKTNAISITAFEYFVDLFVFLFIIFTGMIFLKPLGEMYFSNALLFAAFFVFALLFLALLPELFGFVLNKLQKVKSRFFEKIVSKAVFLLKEVRKVWLKLAVNRQALIAIPLIIVFWLLDFFSHYLLFLAVGVNVDFFYLMVILSATTLLGGISTIPGGLGVRDAGIILLFGVVGVTYSASFFVVVASRLLTIVPISIGYFYSIRMGYSNLKKLQG